MSLFREHSLWFLPPFLVYSAQAHMLPLCKRVGALLQRLLRALACNNGGCRRGKMLRAGFNWPSVSAGGASSSTELSSQLKQVFRLIDSNGDGKISPLELRDVLRCLGHERAAAEREAEGMVREADCDGDGFIDLDEFMEAVDAGGDGSGSREEIMEAFRVFDIDGDGFISAEELRRVLVRLGHGKCSLRESRRMITGVDRNGDGRVDFDEFWGMMTTFVAGDRRNDHV